MKKNTTLLFIGIFIGALGLIGSFWLINKFSDGSISKDFVYPSAIALLTSILSVISTLSFNYFNKRNEKKSKQSDLRIRLTLELRNILDQYASLVKDIEDKKYYAIATLNSSKTSTTLGRLTNLVSEVYIFDNVNLREEIIKTVDESKLLIDDIGVMEYIEMNNFTKYTNKLDAIKLEISNFEKDLLRQNIALDEKFELHEITPDSSGFTKEKIEYVKRILAKLGVELNKSQSDLDGGTKETDRRRALFLSRIIDIRTKISKLIEHLN